MVLQRDTDSIPDARFADTDVGVIHHLFVKVEGGADFGNLRFTTRATNWTGNLDPRAFYGENTGNNAWRGGEVAPDDIRISQTNTSILDVSSISFPNVRDDVEADTGYWMNLDLTYGLKNRVTTVWQAWWPAGDDTDGALDGRYIIFRGRIGAREHAERSNLSLLPFRSSWNIRTGSQLYPTVCRFAVAGLFKDPTTCQYTGGETSCDGALVTCQNTMNNEINFGGHPLMLKPNTVIQIGPADQRQRFTV